MATIKNDLNTAGAPEKPNRKRPAQRPGPNIANRPGQNAANRPAPNIANRPAQTAGNRPALNIANRPAQTAANPPAPAPSAPDARRLPPRKWFFTFMCMNIPIIGWIYLLTRAYGKKENQLKDFCRAYLLYKLVFLVVSLVILGLLVYVGIEIGDRILAYMEML